MLRFLLRRLLSALPTLLVIATLAFVLLHLTPGGPFDSERVLVPQIQHSIEARFHLDEPLWRQYLRYLGDLAHGDLGPSFQYRNTSVN
ncbi:MAG TPA: ABC transporter permease, partial [Steroidobacteraceae bacterium]|nr:ABC transporter permease [Steroidobacteraceae bacterium]